MYSYFKMAQSSAACIMSWLLDTVTVEPCFKFIQCSYSVLEYITLAATEKNPTINRINFQTKLGIRVSNNHTKQINQKLQPTYT
jgi:hypothetical protein